MFEIVWDIIHCYDASQEALGSVSDPPWSNVCRVYLRKDPQFI